MHNKQTFSRIIQKFCCLSSTLSFLLSSTSSRIFRAHFLKTINQTIPIAMKTMPNHKNESINILHSPPTVEHAFITSVEKIIQFQNTLNKRVLKNKFTFIWDLDEHLLKEIDLKNPWDAALIVWLALAVKFWFKLEWCFKKLNEQYSILTRPINLSRHVWLMMKPFFE